MLNLEDFPMPNDGEIPICEINGRSMQYLDSEFSNSTYASLLKQHPKINVAHDLLHNTRLGDEARELFLSTDVPFLKHITQVYFDQGLSEALSLSVRHHNLLVSNGASALLGVFSYLRKLQRVFSPYLEHSGSSIIHELSQTRNWANNPIKCIAWHNHLPRLAVGTSDDSVRIYCNESTFIPILRCKQQKNVTCVAWRPMSLTEIAVGHETGIIIWHVDFSSIVSRPSVRNSVVLHRIDHNPILSLVWSPRGNILVSAAACDTNILVWDVELDKTSTLKGSRDSGNTLLKWSPAMDKLLSVSNSVVFKIWDCHHWESDRWTVLSGRVQAACWSNCGTNLLFATSTEPIIYGLTIKTVEVFTKTDTSSMDKALPLFDLSRVDLNGNSVGGLVQSMETDPKGNHLAVSFKDTNNITLFNVTKFPKLQLIPSSLIVPEFETEIPSVITFQQNYTEGACLTIGWSSGRIQHFPIIYTDFTSSQ